ncbi:MaoC family dehydratase [Notoacmeibacter ruber]|uniref:MaoC family dehydratase n=2 Tax=Notoacmeibacter ruber TaxID=2670375 RepID=A0A3L7JFU1_9HYPH|nr:MaoC family dehydratase [Notoacmeibacter ruber]
MLEPVSLDRLQVRIGEEIGLSRWHMIDQTRIDAFADITEDRNFIHIDPARTKAETPYPTTIAHGFLSLSMLSAFAYEATPPLKGQAAALNYGFDEIRFLSPVQAGSRLRGKFSLLDISTRPSGHIQLTWNVEVEIEGQERPALVAKWISLALMEEERSA